MGFHGEDLERAVKTISADKGRWAQTMVLEEYGLAPLTRSPVKAALCTFGGVCRVWIDTAGALPRWRRPRLPPPIATSVAFLLIGSLKSRWSVRSAWRSGLETLAIGGVAAGLAYAAGHILASLLS